MLARDGDIHRTATMSTSPLPESLLRHEIPGCVRVERGAGGLPVLRVSSPASTGEIHLHGAHVTAFRKHGEPPLLFMSEESQFAEGKPIRGGVPVLFPWFGPRDGAPAHGFVRLSAWDLTETRVQPGGAVSVGFRYPLADMHRQGLEVDLQFRVTMGSELTMELTSRNLSTRAAAEFENCLHTYFSVADIHRTAIAGLKGAAYLDRLDPADQGPEPGEEIRITREFDRVYPDSIGPVEIRDLTLGRRVTVSKAGSRSTVVWNPWVAKSRAMPDFGDEEFHRMVCVESGNIGRNRVRLAPGELSELRVTVSTRPLQETP